jgi:hypothetical protein
MNESIIVIQAEAINPIRTGVVFWSHDRGTAKLRFKLQKDGVNQNLPEGTTVPIRLVFKSSTAQGGYGKHDYLATIEDRLNGIVSIILEDNILGYQGNVEGSIYIDFPNDQSLDTAGRFSFNIKRSPIDDSTPELEDYYFNGFSQTINKIEKMIADAKTEIDEKIVASSTEIDGKLKDTNDKITKANQDVATINSNIDKANDRINQTSQQIGDLGKLKKMYANSIDFGDYDYSGNPNVLPVYSRANVANLMSSSATVTDGGTYLKIEKTQNTEAASIGFGIVGSKYITPMLNEQTQYTLTFKLKAESGFVGTGKNVTLRYRYQNEQNTVVVPVGGSLPNDNFLTDWTEYKFTGTTASTSKGATPYIHLWLEASAQGTLLVDYQIKIERGANSTPFQPNLLEEPYYLSKVPLRENIANKSVVFPIVTSDYKIYGASLQENWQAGQSYTLTMKAAKPSTQSFNVFMNSGTMGVGPMVPVEGKTDVWQKTFTISQSNIDAGVTNVMAVYQVPSSTAGACKIEWLKLEKGDTATPNVNMFKYFGEGLKESNNPSDYSWDITPEYAEKTMGNAVDLTYPQSVEGLKNFKDGIQVGGKNVATIDDLDKAATTTIYNGDGEVSNLPYNGTTFGFGSQVNTNGTLPAFTVNGNREAVCEIAGTYSVTAQIRMQFGATLDGYLYIDLMKNGTVINANSGMFSLGGTGLRNRHAHAGHNVITVAKGDKLSWKTSSNLTGNFSFAGCFSFEATRLGV